MFSYTGAFAIHALCAGAKEVFCVDISQQALNQLKKNADLNEFEGKLNTYCGDY